jgi:hypothetical protein
MRTRTLFVSTFLAPLALATISVLLAFVPWVASASAEGCPNEAIREAQKSADLPDCRAYELVSPPAKNGGSVLADTGRTRAASDGSAVGFAAMAAFGTPLGTGIATDYIAVRDAPGMAGASNGWSTHAITPLQSGSTLDGLTNTLEPLYVGDFTRDLAGGVFFAQSPLTDDPSTAGVPNLYLRTDLRAAGAGTYDLLTRCPLCESNGRPLPALALTDQNGLTANQMRPFVAGMTPDAGHVIFESRQQLTVDTPPSINRVEVYEWDHGTVRLAGRIPPSGDTQCDDVSQAPSCVASSFSVAGQGVGAVGGGGGSVLVPHALSDGSDGHTRIFFTRPTRPDGVTPDPTSLSGQLFMRTDGTSTVQLNAYENSPGIPGPATYLDASADGERVFFSTHDALTNDAPADGLGKIYMYDVTRPAGSRLTFLSRDDEPADGTGSAVGMIGASADGHYAYLVVDSQLVSGQPLLGSSGAGMYLWHDGTLRYIGPAIEDSSTLQAELFSAGTTNGRRQARVTPDGRHMLFSAISGTGLTGYDHGSCSIIGGGCRELYVYSADSGTVACASCNPTGAPATAMATDVVRALAGASQTSVHQNEAITDDGSRVFFSTAEALVPEDINSRSDAYEYDVASRTVHLLSSGTSTWDSWFLDASANGDDAFFVTNEELVGWDRDQAYDLYDARGGGGWPEPSPQPEACGESSCRGPLASAPSVLGAPASATLEGAGNLEPEATKHPPTSRKPLSRTEKLAKALRTCKKKHPRSRTSRVACEKRASRTLKKGKKGIHR